jgi:uncharacterized RDD family membrane protein YckC
MAEHAEPLPQYERASASRAESPLCRSEPEQTVKVAGMWRRLAATIVDAAILSPVLALAFWIAIRVTGYRLPLGPELRVESALELILEGGSMLYSLIGLGLLVLLLYGFLFMSTTGATPGLRLLRLRLITIYGATPEWWRVVLRCLGFVLSAALLGLGFVWMAFDREKRGLHDWLAGTYVIRSARGGAPPAVPGTA